MDIKAALDQLSEYDAQLTALQLREQEIVATLTPKVPEEIQRQINDVHSEFAQQRSGAEANAAELKEQIKKEILATGASVKATRLHAIYVKGRVTWDPKAIEGYAVAHPELFAFKKEGEPSVTFRNV